MAIEGLKGIFRILVIRRDKDADLSRRGKKRPPPKERDDRDDDGKEGGKRKKIDISV